MYKNENSHKGTTGPATIDSVESASGNPAMTAALTGPPLPFSNSSTSSSALLSSASSSSSSADTEDNSAQGQCVTGHKILPPIKIDTAQLLLSAKLLLSAAENAYKNHKITSTEEYVTHAIDLLNALDPAHLPLYRQLKAKLLLKRCFVNLDWGNPVEAAIDLSHAIELQDPSIDEPILAIDTLIIQALLCLHQQRTVETIRLLSEAWTLAQNNQKLMMQVSTYLLWAVSSITSAVLIGQETPPTGMEPYMAFLYEWQRFFRKIHGEIDEIWWTIKHFITDMSGKDLCIFDQSKKYPPIFWQNVLSALRYQIVGPSHLFISMPLNLDQMRQLIVALSQPDCKTTSLKFVLDYKTNKRNLDQMKMLAAALPYTQLTTLCLRGCNINDEIMIVLSAVLPNTQLEILSLNKNVIGNIGLIRLAEQLPKSKLRMVNLAGNRFDCEGVRALAAALPSSAVTHLDLSGNVFSDVGLSALTSAMIDFRCTITVLKLDLYISHINTAQIFLSALANSPLTTLELHFRKSDSDTSAASSKMTRECMQALIKTLSATTCHINTLKLDGSIDANSFRLFTQTLPGLQLTTLKIGPFDKIETFNELMQALSAGLYYSNIKILDLSQWPFSVETNIEFLLAGLAFSSITGLRFHEECNAAISTAVMAQITHLLKENKNNQVKKDRSLCATLLLSGMISPAKPEDNELTMNYDPPPFPFECN